MRWFWAIGITLLIFAGMVALLALTEVNLGPLVALACAGWAALDARQLNLDRKNQSLFSSPGAVFVCVLILWPVAFPLYLATRDHLQPGSASGGPQDMCTICGSTLRSNERGQGLCCTCQRKAG